MSDKETRTLESVLRERLSAPRAMVGALSINADRILLTFGDVGVLPRVVLHIDGDTPRVLHPEWLIPSEEPEDTGGGVVTLYGSNTLPADIQIGREKVQLGEVVARAHTDSGLAVDEWNALPDAERETILAETIETMRVEAEEAARIKPEDHTKADLLDMAAKAGLTEITDKNTKAEIAAALNAPPAPS